jgi:hypothetical protein
MRRPAIVLFGVVACWTERAPQPIGHQAVQTQDSLAGSYWCTITEGDYTYPRFPCAITDQGGQLVLAKLAGSVRFKGEIRRNRAGFSFEGRMFCPWGDCTQALHGRFAARGAAWLGTFSDNEMTVVIGRAGGLGGDGYGGDSYGGATYGGTTYGNYAPSGRRNRRQLRPIE